MAKGGCAGAYLVLSGCIRILTITILLCGAKPSTSIPKRQSSIMLKATAMLSFSSGTSMHIYHIYHIYIYTVNHIICGTGILCNKLRCLYKVAQWGPWAYSPTISNLLEINANPTKHLKHAKHLQNLARLDLRSRRQHNTQTQFAGRIIQPLLCSSSSIGLPIILRISTHP